MEWRTIETHPEYEVSQSGLVRSLKGGKEKMMTLRISNVGYMIVDLRNRGKKTYTVHRLVGKAFIPNHDNLPDIDHINRDRTDNRVENLRWVTRSENIINACDRSNHRHITQNKSGWEVRIIRNQQHAYRGWFKTLEEAQVNRTIQLLFI